MKPKVALVITRANIGGAQNYVYWTMEVLQEKFDFKLIIGSKGYLTEKVEKLGIEYKVIPEIDSRNIISATLKLRREIRHLQPDLINTHSTLAAIYARLANIRLKTPVIYSVHGWFFTNNAHWTRRTLGPWVEKLLAPLVGHWITETAYDQDLGLAVGAIHSKNRVTVIPNGTPKPPLQKQLYLDPSEIQLVFVGRESYQKDPYLAVEILNELPSNYVLTMYTRCCPDSKLLRMVRDRAIAPRIRIIQNEPNTLSILSNYDLLLSTSRYEGMPLALIEAMANSLPIVASDVCGLSELVIEEENGCLINSRNPVAYARAIRGIINNPAKKLKFQSGAKNLYQNKHTIEKMCASISTVMALVIKA